jgi:hypothetical protein
MVRMSCAIVLAALLTACGGDSTGPGTSVLQLAGSWNYSDNISSSSAGMSCTSAGTVTVNQTGSNFSGSANATSGVCTDSFGGSIDNTGVSSITGGQVSGSQVSFQVPNCQFTGAVSGNPPNSMSGTETCTLAVSGTNYTFTGTWQASR